VIVPANFGEVWTRFDIPIIEFWIEPRGKTEFPTLGQYFYLTPIKPTLGFEIVRSTGE